jgi:hypothetical protein
MAKAKLTATETVMREENQRRPDVLPTAPNPVDVVRPVAPVVTGSHVLATASGGLDFDKKSVFFDLTAVGQDDLTSALLGKLLDGSVPATVTVKHDITGLKLRVDFAEDAAFDEVAALAEDARRGRAGLPTDAELADQKAKQDAAVAAEDAAALAAAKVQSDTEDRIVKKVLARLKTAKPKPEAKPKT